LNRERLSYHQLHERSNQLAHYLKKRGVKQETLVPICIERGLDMIVGMLAILKAGGAYVPIDPEYPQERISYMLEDTAAKIIISSSKTKSKLENAGGIDILELDEDWAAIGKESVNNLPTNPDPNQLAYVIYTSGSTGKPKGVMIEHGNLYSFICWSRDEFASSHFEIVYASTSICFDLSVFEIFYPLTIGKPVRIVENGLAIEKWLSQDSFVMTNTVPVVMEHLLKEGIDLSNITVINMAGEPVPLYVQQGLDTERIEVRNLYGPTEDTTYSTIYRLQKDEPLLIGKPISNTQVHITSADGQLVPIGVPGEICIAGSGVTRGYLNRPELTAEKFVSNPFSKEAGARMYKTG
jgi:amino acid adenylation domain-containing protein